MQKLPAHEGALYTKLCTFPKKPDLADLKKEWCVYFDYYHDGQWHPIRRKGNINRIKTFKEKCKELSALKQALIMAMDQGWNPVTKRLNERPEETKALNENMNIIEALDFAFSQCDVSDNTIKNYRCCLSHVKKAIASLRLERLVFRDVKRKHIKLIMEKAQHLSKWTNNSYNKNLGYLQGIISYLLEWDIIEYNPAHRIKKKKVFESKPKFEPYTEQEKKLISETLFLQHYGFFVYLMTIYHTGMRPMEVLALKVKDIDLRNTMIEIVPTPTRRNSKTKKVRQVQINEHLMPLLREWIKGVNNKELYVFGSPYTSGLGNRGSGMNGAMSDEYFKPSSTRIKRDTTTRLWKRIIWDGLGIHKHQYAAKHTGCDDKLLAGISMEAIKEMFGHTTDFMTKRYETVLRKIHRNEINLKSPAFINQN